MERRSSETHDNKIPDGSKCIGILDVRLWAPFWTAGTTARDSFLGVLVHRMVVIRYVGQYEGHPYVWKLPLPNRKSFNHKP